MIANGIQTGFTLPINPHGGNHHALLLQVGGIRWHGARPNATQLCVMRSIGDKTQEPFFFIMNGKNDSEVWKVRASEARMVGDHHVTGLQVHGLHDLSDTEAHRPQMHRDVRCVGDQSSLDIQKGTGKVEPLLDVGGQGGALKHQTHLFDQTEKAMREEFQLKGGFFLQAFGRDLQICSQRVSGQVLTAHGSCHGLPASIHHERAETILNDRGTGHPITGSQVAPIPHGYLTWNSFQMASDMVLRLKWTLLFEGFKLCWRRFGAGDDAKGHQLKILRIGCVAINFPIAPQKLFDGILITGPIECFTGFLARKSNLQQSSGDFDLIWFEAFADHGQTGFFFHHFHPSGKFRMNVLPGLEHLPFAKALGSGMHEAKGAQQTCLGREEDPIHLESIRHPAGVLSSSTSESGQSVVLGIVTLPNGDARDGLSHALIGHVSKPLQHGFQCQFRVLVCSGLVKQGQGRFVGSLRRKGDPKQGRVHTPQEDVDVGQGQWTTGTVRCRPG